MQSKYWWMCGASEDADLTFYLSDKDDDIRITLHPEGDCHIEIDIKNINLAVFVAAMHEAHDLAREHFGGEWGKSE